MRNIIVPKPVVPCHVIQAKSWPHPNVEFPKAYKLNYHHYLDFPGGSDRKESFCNAGDLGLIPGLGRHPRERNGNPLQYSCLENPMDRL